MGKNREYHGDGSYTDRYGDESTITYNKDGSVRHSTGHGTTGPLGLGRRTTKTLGGHHTLEEYLDAYLAAAGIRSDPKGPLFRTAVRLPGRPLTENRMEQSNLITDPMPCYVVSPIPEEEVSPCISSLP